MTCLHPLELGDRYQFFRCEADGTFGLTEQAQFPGCIQWQLTYVPFRYVNQGIQALDSCQSEELVTLTHRAAR